MSRYDYHGICPICNSAISWINGKTNSDVVIIKTKRHTTNYYHKKCIEKECKHL